MKPMVITTDRPPSRLRNCMPCGKFMTLTWSDGGPGWWRQDWECKCGRKDMVESEPVERPEPDPDAYWDSRSDR